MLPTATPPESAGFLMYRMRALGFAVLLHFEALTIVDLVLHRDVVAVLATGAFEGDLHPLVVPGHDRVPCYLMILTTRPAPTVRPPSRIANRRPSSIAIGLPNCTVIATLSPGITISVPSGN